MIKVVRIHPNIVILIPKSESKISSGFSQLIKGFLTLSLLASSGSLINWYRKIPNKTNGIVIIIQGDLAPPNVGPEAQSE